MKPPRRLTRFPLAALVTLATTACDDGNGLDPLSLEATGEVTATVLFDANGSRTADAADDPLEDWTLDLQQPAGGTVATGETDANGTVVFEDVPVGRLVLTVGSDELGDTLSAVEATVQPFTLPADGQVAVTTLVTLDSASISEARQIPPGRPIFVTGVALNGLSADVDDLHLRSGGDFIRVLSVETGNVLAGDSVRVRGRTDIDGGVPVLDGQEVFTIGPRVGLTPIPITTAEAADARGGSLDAALVQITDAEIVEVENLGNDGVRLEVDDGTGPVDIVLRPFLGFEARDFDPDDQHVTSARGLLVPGQTDGRVTWRLLPRSTADINVQQL